MKLPKRNPHKRIDWISHFLALFPLTDSFLSPFLSRFCSLVSLVDAQSLSLSLYALGLTLQHNGKEGDKKSVEEEKFDLVGESLIEARRVVLPDGKWEKEKKNFKKGKEIARKKEVGRTKGNFVKLHDDVSISQNSWFLKNDAKIILSLRFESLINYINIYRLNVFKSTCQTLPWIQLEYNNALWQVTGKYIYMYT